MAYSKNIEVTQLANDDFEMFVDSVETIPKLRQARYQNMKQHNESAKLTSIKVYEIRRLPKFCKSLQYYKKEIEIPVNYSDSEEESDRDTLGSLIRSSSIRQAYRRKRSDTGESNLSKLKGIQLKRAKGMRFNKDGYAYRFWKKLINS